MSQFNTCESWSNISESVLVQNFPLHRACRDGDMDFISNLLHRPDFMKNAQICKEDTYYGWTPLHWAAYFGKLECIRLLMASSDISSLDLRTSRFNQTPTHIAAFAGHFRCLEWMLQAGSDPNATDYLGEGPLHKAARSGSEECVMVLLRSSVHIGARNASGKTAAELAENCRHANIARYLLAKETDGEISPFLKFVSCNGYHGYHHLSRDQPSATESCMEVEQSPFDNARLRPDLSPSNLSNGAANGNLAVFKDVTLCADVSRNQSTVGGKKRSREESDDCRIKKPRSEEATMINGVHTNLSETKTQSKQSESCTQMEGLQNGSNPDSRFPQQTFLLNNRLDASPETNCGVNGDFEDNSSGNTAHRRKLGGSGGASHTPFPVDGVSERYLVGGCANVRVNCLLGHYM